MQEQQKATIGKLFTFGEEQLSECLRAQAKRKFPFMNNPKIKKLAAYQKIVSQQRPTKRPSSQILQNVASADLEQPTLKYQFHKATDLVFSRKSNNQNINCNLMTASDKKEKKKLSLPKVFRGSMSNHKNSHLKRRTPSSESAVRYQNEDDNIMVRPFASQEQEKPEKKRKTLEHVHKPKSLMFLSSLESEIPEQKFKTLGTGGRTFKRPNRYKSSLSSEFVYMDPQVNHNIQKLRRIYS